MFKLKIFVRVQTFRRVPPVLPRNFCHPAVLQLDFDRVSSWTVAFLTLRLLLWLRNLGYTWFSVHCLVYGYNLLKWKKSSRSLFADRLDFQPVLCVSMIHAIIHEKEYVLKFLCKPSLSPHHKDRKDL